MRSISSPGCQRCGASEVVFQAWREIGLVRMRDLCGNDFNTIQWLRPEIRGDIVLKDLVYKGVNELIETESGRIEANLEGNSEDLFQDLLRKYLHEHVHPQIISEIFDAAEFFT